MLRNKTQLVVILLLVTLIPMATFVFLPYQSVSGFTVSRIPVPGTTTLYEEDFSTTTYLDGGSTTAEGSSTVFVNGIPAARIGDPVACGSACARGSTDVFAGG